MRSSNRMKYVELYKLENGGSQRVALRCRLEGARAICEGDPALKANLEAEGIEDFGTPGGPQLFPKDGLRFLEQLASNFSSGYLNASEVKDS